MLSGHLFPRSQLLIYCHLVESRSSKKQRLPSTGGALSGGKALYSRAARLEILGDIWRHSLWHTVIHQAALLIGERRWKTNEASSLSSANAKIFTSNSLRLLVFWIRGWVIFELVTLSAGECWWALVSAGERWRALMRDACESLTSLIFYSFSKRPNQTLLSMLIARVSSSRLHFGPGPGFRWYHSICYISAL